MLQLKKYSLEKQWEIHWQHYKKLSDTGTFYGKWATVQKLKILEKSLRQIPVRNINILETGCGSGETLEVFKRLGFKNIYGIDTSLQALKYCGEKGFKIGKNVFQQDAKKTFFEDKFFTIVFEDGLWEHSTNYTPFVCEACRLTSDYLIALQPNHFSFIGATAKISWELFSKNKGGIREYSIPLSHFKKLVSSLGFHFEFEHSTFLKGYYCMVFRRNKNG